MKAEMQTLNAAKLPRPYSGVGIMRVPLLSPCPWALIPLQRNITLLFGVAELLNWMVMARFLAFSR